MQIQLFSRLRSIEQQLRTLQRERDALLGTFSASDGVATLRAERRALIRTLKEERARYIDLEWELDEAALRIKALAEQDRAGPTDLLVVRELVALRKRAAQLEEQALWQLERIGELEAHLKLADATIAHIDQSPLSDETRGGICCS